MKFQLSGLAPRFQKQSYQFKGSGQSMKNLNHGARSAGRVVLRGMLVCCATISTAAGGHLTRYDYSRPRMGMPVKLALYTSDEATAKRAAQAVYDHFDRLNQIFSDYDPDSELSRLSHSAPHSGPIPVSQPLWDILNRSQTLSKQTDGAFDVTVGPMVRLWRRARRQLELPSAERLAEARQATGWQNLLLDPKTHGVQLLRPKMQLDLGGIAAGYAVDEGLKILASHGIRSAMIDASGDIAASAAPPCEPGWRIAIIPLNPNGKPTQFLYLANAAITTSGGAFQHVEIGGQRYSHIVDPHTGLGQTVPSAVTVYAPDCTTADSLATAVSVLGPTAGIALIEKHAGTSCLIYRGGVEKTEVYRSSRWHQLPFACNAASETGDAPPR